MESILQNPSTHFEYRGQGKVGQSVSLTHGIFTPLVTTRNKEIEMMKT